MQLGLEQSDDCFHCLRKLGIQGVCLHTPYHPHPDLHENYKTAFLWEITTALFVRKPLLKGFMKGKLSRGNCIPFNGPRHLQGWRVWDPGRRGGGKVCEQLSAPGRFCRWPERNLGTSQVAQSTGQTGNAGSTPGSGRSLGEVNGSPLQYSCLEKSQEPRRLAGCSPWGCKEWHTSELTHTPSTTCRLGSSAFFPVQHSVILYLRAEVPLGV